MISLRIQNILGNQGQFIAAIFYDGPGNRCVLKPVSTIANIAVLQLMGMILDIMCLVLGVGRTVILKVHATVALSVQNLVAVEHISHGGVLSTVCVVLIALPRRISANVVAQTLTKGKILDTLLRIIAEKYSLPYAW